MRWVALLMIGLIPLFILFAVLSLIKQFTKAYKKKEEELEKRMREE